MTPEEIIEQARKQFAEDEAWEKDLRDEFREDVRFRAGLQWPAGKAEAREAQGRPAMVHNRIPTFVSSVTNECRQNKPSLGYTPVEDADEDTGKILEGLARNIQYDSQASTAYETANEYQVVGSFGHFRMVSEYVGNDSFDQEVKIKEVVNPLSVYGVLRPAIMRQKCRHAFVVETLTREEYKRLYGESGEFLSFAEHDTTGWVSTDEVRVAEYWWVESKKKTLALLHDGTTMDLALVPQEVRDLPADPVAGTKAGVQDTRVVQEDTVHWCKINGAEILPDTETEWVGENIPIYTALGLQAIVDDKPMLFSLVRFMRSPQQMINYTKSRIAESLMATPVGPPVGAEGQFEGHEREWDEAAIKPVSRLEYKPISIAGTVLGPPRRDVYEPPIGAMSAFLAQEIDELKAISGIFDASLGSKSNETSGRAIQARQQQSTQTNMHFLDNLSRAYEQCGRDLAEVIPKIYDGTRIVRILGEDETRGSEWINKPGEDGKIKFDISAGKYDVAVKIGRMYSTKRLESFDTLGQLIQGNPGLLPTIGDIVFRNSDMAGADEISERFKKMLPPGLAEDDKDKPVQIPPQVQAQLQGLDQQNQQLTAALNQMTEEAKIKAAEIASRERIVEVQETTKRIIAAAQMGSAEAIVELELRVDTLNQQVERTIAQQRVAEDGTQAQAAAPQAEAPEPEAGPGQETQ